MKAAAIIVGCAAGVSAHQHYASGTGVCSVARTEHGPREARRAARRRVMPSLHALDTALPNMADLCGVHVGEVGSGPVTHGRAYGSEVIPRA